MAKDASLTKEAAKAKKANEKNSKKAALSKKAQEIHRKVLQGFKIRVQKGCVAKQEDSIQQHGCCTGYPGSIRYLCLGP